MGVWFEFPKAKVAAETTATAEVAAGDRTAKEEQSLSKRSFSLLNFSKENLTKHIQSPRTNKKGLHVI